MRKVILSVLMILTVSLYYGVQEEVTPLSQNSVNISINNVVSLRDGDVLIEEEVKSFTLAFSSRDIEVNINQAVIGHYNHKGVRVGEVNQAADYVRIGDRFTFREMTGYTIDVIMKTRSGHITKVVEELDFDVTGSAIIQTPSSISRAFYHSYKALADNYRNSYLVNLPFKQPGLMIVTDETYNQALIPFVEWKRQKGFEVTTVTLDEIGGNPTNNQIREHIRDLYHNADNKPEYLLLVGSVSGNNPLPTFHHLPQNDATDLPYGLLEGDDYFPEMLVGRLSVTSEYQLAAIINKTIEIEKEPFMVDTDWMKRALVVSGNFATVLPIPDEPNRTAGRIARLFSEAGYEVIDIYWNMGDGGYGTQEIIDALNNGVQYVTALGWGDANGWHYPQFHIMHLSNVISPSKNPYVSSFICNTGDYANPYIDPCFGEYWMRQGSPNNPVGAASFVGSTDLYTSTQFNNVLAYSYHFGIQKEGIRNAGAALLRAKVELYRNFPNERQPGQWVEHYFHVYGLLSDPSMSQWVLVPGEIDIEIPESISAAAAHLQLETGGLNSGYVTITRDGEVYETFKIDDNRLFIPLQADDTRNILITVTADNKLPLQKIIEVSPVRGVAMTDYDFNRSMLIPGSRVSMNFTLRNFSGSQVDNVTASLHTYTGQYVTITSGEYEFGNLNAGGTASGSFMFDILPETPRHTPLQFRLDISPGDNSAKIQTIVGGILLLVDSYQVQSGNNLLDPGETADISLTIINKGEADASGLHAQIIPGSNAVTVQNDPVDFGDIPVGERSTRAFSVTAAADAYIGREVYFQLDFEDESGLLTTSLFNITLGEVDNTAPTGSCSYGYFAYDSFDTGYEQAPVYEWIEIDPEQGGPGTDNRLHDDGAVTVGLPFTFRYYGREYDNIYICSNGWVTFEETALVSYINYSIPSPVNPDGIIAPLWDDLTGKPDVADSLRVAWWHDEDNNRFIITWLDAYNRANVSPAGLEMMQLILEPREGRDGDIIFQYHTVWNRNQGRNYSTVGIQSPCNTKGLQYSFNNTYPLSATELQAELAIRFTTQQPDIYTYYADNIYQPALKLELKQNYPNPFNPETTISFTLPREETVTLDVYNIIGQRVKRLINGKLPPGVHSISWNGYDDDGTAVSSGVYFYKIETPNNIKVKRMLLLK